MVAKSKTQKKKISVLENPLLEKVRIAFEKYIDTVGAINDDYLIDDNAISEMAQADEDFRETLTDLDSEETEALTVDGIVYHIKENSIDEDDAELILKAIDYQDTDFIDEYAKDRFGDIILKIDSMAHREKLREFLETEIWPDYNQQCENINF